MPHFRVRHRGRIALAVAAAFSTGLVTALAPVASAEPGRTGAEQKYLVLF
jgi:hypothetical protein